MSDDILREASRALRDTTTAGNDSERFTRARIMASLHKRRRSRGTRLALLVPLAAVLFGSTAFAAATGRLPRVITVVAEAVGVEVVSDVETKQPVAPVRRWVATRPAARAQQLVAALPEASPVPTPAAAEELLDESAEDEAHDDVTAEAAGGVGAKRKRAARDQLVLYRRAHRAHFEQRRPAAALAAWEAYLRAAPGGRFAVEARYNRAMCLVRLGRSEAARKALAPFARGAFGGYRQEEARRLVEALGGTSTTAQP